MKVKYVLITITLIITSTFAYGQTYFSKVYNFDFPNVVFTNILQEGDSLMITSIINDVIDPIANSVVLTCDLEGNVGRVNRFDHNFGAFDAWWNNLNKLNDSTYVLGVEGYFPKSQAGIILFNKNGDITKSDFRVNPLYPYETFVVSNDILISENNLIYYALKNVSIETTADIKVYKYNNDLFVLDSLNISLDFLGNLFSLETSADNQLLLGMYQFQLTSNDYTYENIIQKRDTNFNLIWEYRTETDSLYSSLLAMTTTSDSGIIAVTFTGTEFFVNPGSNDYCREDVYVYKLDNNGQLIWDKIIPIDGCNPNFKFITNINELSDNTLLLAGTLPYNNKFRGTLIKLSDQGDLLWERYYIHEEKDVSFIHSFRDMAVLDNGDVVMCGESGGPQEGWLMKVDSMGCLIPGCTTAISTISPDHSIEMMIAPNPVQDQLILHLAVASPYKKGNIQIIDMQGQVVKSLENDFVDNTHIIDVSGISAGSYQVVYSSNGQVIGSERMVKM